MAAILHAARNAGTALGLPARQAVQIAEARDRQIGIDRSAPSPRPFQREARFVPHKNQRSVLTVLVSRLLDGGGVDRVCRWGARACRWFRARWQGGRVRPWRGLGELDP
jgi:hypothetical protein